MPSELLAAFLCAQLEARERVQSRRREIWQGYYSKLANWAAATGVRLPVIPPHCDQSFHLFYLLLPSADARESLRAHLAAAGITGLSHYVPLHLSPMAQRLQRHESHCPVTEDVSGRLLRLPFYGSLSELDQDRVVTAITAWPRSR